MATTLGDVEAKKIGNQLGDVEAEAPVDTLLDTLSEVLAKIIADSQTCVEAEAPVKTGDTVARLQAYTVVGTPNKVEAKALVYT